MGSPSSARELSPRYLKWPVTKTSTSAMDAADDVHPHKVTCSKERRDRKMEVVRERIPTPP